MVVKHSNPLIGIHSIRLRTLYEILDLLLSINEVPIYFKQTRLFNFWTFCFTVHCFVPEPIAATGFYLWLCIILKRSNYLQKLVSFFFSPWEFICGSWKNRKNLVSLLWYYILLSTPISVALVSLGSLYAAQFTLTTQLKNQISL